MHDRPLATTLCKGLLCTRAISAIDIRLLKPLRKSQDVLSCLGSPSTTWNLQLCTTTQNTCVPKPRVFANWQTWPIVDSWMIECSSSCCQTSTQVEWVPTASNRNSTILISSVNGLKPLPYFAMASPWYVGEVFCSDMFRPSMSRVFLNFASLSNLRKPLFVSWHAQHVNAATGRYKDMSSSWGKTKEAATGDLSLWKHAMRRHPIFRLVPPLAKCFYETVTWSQQGKHLEGCELNKSF